MVKILFSIERWSFIQRRLLFFLCKSEKEKMKLKFCGGIVAGKEGGERGEGKVVKCDMSHL